MVLGAILSFVVSLLLSGAAIYIGASMLADVQDFGLAVMTAFFGTVALMVTDFFLGWIPLVGFAAALLAYLTVVNLAYPGGYVKAAGISLIALVTEIVVTLFLAFFLVLLPF